MKRLKGFTINPDELFNNYNNLNFTLDKTVTDVELFMQGLDHGKSGYIKVDFVV